jgi:hypothetical protein
MRPLLLLLAVSSLPAVAHADIPQPPPASCPRGSQAASNRTSSYCAPTDCAYCGGDQRCSPEPIGLCVVTSDVPVPPPPGIQGPTGSMRIQHVTGPCENGRCAEGARCERAPRCLPASDPAFDSGLCSAGHRGTRTPLVALALAALALRRRG